MDRCKSPPSSVIEYELMDQGRWWFSQRRMTRDGILNTTAESFFHQLRDDTDFISLIAILASAAEISALLGKKGSKKEKKERQTKVEELEKVIEARREELGVDENVMMKQENRIEVKTAPARRARALLWAHLLRMDLEDAEMKSGTYLNSHYGIALIVRTRLYPPHHPASPYRPCQHLLSSQLASNFNTVHVAAARPRPSFTCRSLPTCPAYRYHTRTSYRDGDSS